MKCWIVCLTWMPLLWAQEPVTFPSGDGLPISADYYPAKEAGAPLIVACHQARWSRGEYRETAPWLNEHGFAVLAIDQRSGGRINGVDNQTHRLAKERGLSTFYRDAKQDIEAAIGFAGETYRPGEVILLGSSYSASLVLRIAGENHSRVAAVIAFSPGEYFNHDPQFITSVMTDVAVPVFITSAQSEADSWREMAERIPAAYRNTFQPGIQGEHGSRALWRAKPGSDLYRKALLAFLDSLKRS